MQEVQERERGVVSDDMNDQVSVAFCTIVGALYDVCSRTICAGPRSC